MEGQRVLTSYFNAAKSRQNTHPAKRRKVEVDINFIAKKCAKLVEEKSETLSVEKIEKSTAHVYGAKASGKAKQNSRSKSRTVKKTRAADQDKVVSDGVVAVATSSQDDHGSARLRKQNLAKNTRTIVELSATAKETIPTAAPVEIKPKMGQTESKMIPSATETTSQDSEIREKSSPKLSSAPKPNISEQARTGLKINPWISEQSKLVLSSRGRQALEKSLRKSKVTRSSDKVVEAKSLTPPKEVPKVQPKAEIRGEKLKVNVPRLSQEIATTSANSTISDSSDLPAYKRFSRLLETKKPAQPSGITRNLPLPYHFKELEEKFRCIDVVLSLKRKRYETCTFEKLKDSVQEMCRKKFEKKHLAQMKTVYPTAFVFHQQSTSSGTKKSGYQLTIDFNLEGGKNPKDFKFIESSILVARQKQFKKELMKITMAHHQEYLTKHFPSLVVGNDAILRWHPCFPLDEVPEVEQGSLPEPPQVKTYSTAQDVLGQARLNFSPRVEKALNLVAKKSTETNNVKSTTKSVVRKKETCQARNQNSALKGISQSLIDKIRQKEEKKVHEALTVDSEVVQKRVMIQRFPELCRILKTYFVSERKAAIPLEEVSNKLSESYTSTLSSVQVEKHVKLLSEVAPEWLSIMYVRKCPYVKLKKNVNLTNLLEKLKTKEVN